MKKYQRIDATRNIKKRIISYLSIVLIVTIGIGGCFSTRYMGTGLKYTAAQYFDECNLRNFEIYSSLGITEEDINILKEMDEVQDVEGTFSYTGTLSAPDQIYNITLLCLNERISKAKLFEGSYPTKTNECLIGKDFAKSSNLSIGDTITVTIPDINEKPAIHVDTFTITGIMAHPHHPRANLDWNIGVLKEVFNMDATSHAYTSVLVRTNTPMDIHIFDNVRNSKRTDLEQKLWDKTYELKEETLTYFIAEANRRIDEEWEKIDKELNDAQTKIDDGRIELENTIQEARDQIADARSQIQDGKDQIASARNQLANASQQLKNGEAEIANAEAQIKDAKSWIERGDRVFTDYSPDQAISLLNEGKQLAIQYRDTDVTVDEEAANQAQAELDAYLQRSDVQEAFNIANQYYGVDIRSQLKPGTYNVGQAIPLIDTAVSAIQKYQSAKSQLPSLEQKVRDGKVQIENGWKEYNDNVKKVDEEEAKLVEAENEVNTKEEELNQKEKDGYQKLEDAQVELDQKREEAIQAIKEAREEAENIDCNLVVQRYMANRGFMDIYTGASGIDSSGVVFGLLFAYVTALVCFSSLTILIEEDKKLVGTNKAFGLRNREILNKYLAFGVSAAIIGSILGVIVAYCISQFTHTMLANQGLYLFGKAISVVDPYSTGLACVGMVVICYLATRIACAQLLKTPASLLMKGDTIASRDRKAKKKQLAKNTGSLYSHLIVRNILDEKPRVLISIIIIASSALIIGTGVTLKSSFDLSFDHQENDIFRYDYRFSLKDGISDEQVQHVEEIFKEKGISYIPTYYRSHMFITSNGLSGCYLISVDPNTIDDFFHMADPVTKETVHLEDTGMVVQNMMIRSYDIHVGKKLVMLDSDLKQHHIMVTNQFNNYQGKYAFMSFEAYKKAFGKDPEINSFYLQLNGADYEALKAEIEQFIEPNRFVFESKGYARDLFSSVTNLFSIIVIILTIMAILMSFMILTNLANIYISRKKKELIVMRVNGFSINQTINYLARETIVTTLIGLIIGIAAGIPMAAQAVEVMMPVDTQFANDFVPQAWIIAFLFEGVFAICINWFIFRKVKDLNFREIDSV